MNDLECPERGGELQLPSCANCAATYEHVLGVPFIGSYEADDALGLIEIAANIFRRDSLALAPDAVEKLDALCAKYEEAAGKEAFVKAHPEAAEPWFANRFNEQIPCFEEFVATRKKHSNRLKVELFAHTL